MSARANPSVDTHQIVAAGLAATCAAFVTSRFGVAGTLLGAGITAMIITGGSAVLKAYIENAAGRVRSGATRLRERRDTGPAEQAAPTEAPNPPGRPDLRNNFAGRMRAAVEWFRNLPTPARRPILIKALAAAAVALVICLVAIWGVEKIIGNSLSCGLWGTCSVGATPGIDPLGLNGTGASSTLSGGRLDVSGGNSLGGGGDVLDRVQEGVPGVPGGDAAPSSASPDAGGENPSSASPAPEPEPAPEEPPASASPAAEDKNNADASASPAAQ